MREYRGILRAHDARKDLHQAARSPDQPFSEALIRDRAEVIDRLLVGAWGRADLADTDPMCLVAVGGYGRGELHPGSDIDLLILLGEQLDARAEDAVREFVAFLWDIGLEIAHSVRSVEQCIRDARDDVIFATTLMEARRLAGAPALFPRLRDALSPARMWPTRAFFEAKLREQRERHQRFNDTEYNLEPNVKEGPGGLRDIQTVSWVAKRQFGADTLRELVSHGFLNESEYETLAAGQGFLGDVRFALHVIAGRREDRLLFHHQRSLAQAFGYRDDGTSLAVEQFMKRYYRWIMELSRLNEMLLELFQEAILYADARREVTRSTIGSAPSTGSSKRLTTAYSTGRGMRSSSSSSSCNSARSSEACVHRRFAWCASAVISSTTRSAKISARSSSSSRFCVNREASPTSCDACIATGSSSATCRYSVRWSARCSTTCFTPTPSMSTAYS